MAAPQLTPAEKTTLAQASRLLQGGDARQAAGMLSPLVSGGNRHPDVLLVFSTACERLGMLPNAAGAAKAALDQAPERADVWAHFGRLLHDAGHSADGAGYLERAVVLEPLNANHWYNLGVAALSAKALARSVEALEKATQIESANAAAWGALGLAQQQSQKFEEAEKSFRKALELNPKLHSAAHNLALTLRRLDRADEALGILDQAISNGLSAPETKTARGHILGDLGRFEEAVESYEALIAETPGAIDAHETLARLLPQVGRGDRALATYDESLTRAPTAELFRSALNTAWDIKQPAMLERWSKDALARFGDQPEFRMMEGLAYGLAGDSQKALSILEPLADAGFTPVLPHCAYYRLKLGDLKQAETHSVAATRAVPHDQATWAYLTVIWRLMDDPREKWLADYERLVMPIEFGAPEGYESIKAFMGDLARELTELHQTNEHPADQSLRQGTQTRGNLFNRRLPMVRQLSGMIERGIARVISSLPVDDTHPFLSRNTGKTRFLGSWSVRLRDGGFHLSHIHQEGWLSSALYVALPPEVEAGPRDGVPPGSLTFGVPDRELGLDLSPRRVEIPEVGRLVVFPSYFWHQTVPFESNQHRMTVAFDAEPA